MKLAAGGNHAQCKSGRGAAGGCIPVPVETAGNITESNSGQSIEIIGIHISLHLDIQADITVVPEKHYEKLPDNSHLQPTRVAIRSYSGEGKGPALPLLGKFTATLSQGEKK